MASKKSDPPESIGRALNFATGRLNAVCAQLLDPYELSLPQWVILSCLWRDAELPVSALADLIGTGLPATSRLVDRMAERGLVLRKKHEADQRVVVVALTQKGRELDHLSDFYERVNSIVMKGFSAEERALAFTLLFRMRENAIQALSEEQQS